MVAAGVQIGFTGGFQSADYTAALWPWYLCGQIVQTITILSSCVPYLRQLLEAFPATMFTNAYTELPYGSSQTQTHSYRLQPVYNKTTSTPISMRTGVSSTQDDPVQSRAVGTTSTAGKGALSRMPADLGAATQATPPIKGEVTPGMAIGVEKTVETKLERRA